MKHIQIRLTDEEYELLQKSRRGIPKQIYCKKKILDQEMHMPDFEKERQLDDSKPDFYFYVNIRLSLEERKALDELRGDMTVQEFCRRAVLGAKIVKVDELQDIKYQLSKIGNNINQIAKVANQTGIIEKADILDFTRTFEKVIEAAGEIVKSINERFA